VFRDVGRLALLTGPPLVVGIPSMDYQPELKIPKEILEESDEISPMDPIRSNKSSKINDVLDPPDH